ncbi:neuronal acetylcholine receptor subunit beta-3-like [Centruroides vittatus]|uniref:neuronal acetylcholine receptor subunit beta-3-like n=1 Tax=Centruroides vittatus TaxID=120091 RepID=UPI003510BB15
MAAYKLHTMFLCILPFLVKGNLNDDFQHLREGIDAITEMELQVFGNETIMDHYRRLRQHLTADYDVNARPVKYNTNVTEVYVYIVPFSIMNVDEEKQTMDFDCTIFLHWIDQHLTWKEIEFNNISFLTMPPKSVWKPDVFEIHSGGPQSSITEINSTDVEVHSEGDVFWAIPTSLIGRCDFNYDDYPLDAAKCKISLENWTNRGSDVNFIVPHPEPYMEYFNNDNPYWNMKECHLDKTDIRFGIHFYPRVELILLLARRQPIPQYQLQWVISVIAVLLTLCMFWIPADIRQKLTLGCVVIIILTVSLVTITSTVKVPQVAKLIAKPIRTTMFVVLVAIVFEVIINNFRYIQDYEPPEFILNIFSGTVAKLLVINSVRTEEKPMEKVNLYENQDELAPLQRLTKNENWQIIAQIVDRILFIFYVLLLSSIPKTI